MLVILLEIEHQYIEFKVFLNCIESLVINIIQGQI
jgi:hypothetical protein